MSRYWVRFDMWINAGLFQVGWLVCVLQRDFLAVLVTGLLLLTHVLFIRRDKQEYPVIGLVALWGLLQDTLLMQLGVFRIEGSDLPPPWLLAIWLLFGTTLNHSLAWLRLRPLWALVAGALTGPLSYLAGQRLGALELTLSRLPLLSLAWAIALPSLLWASNRIMWEQTS